MVSDHLLVAPLSSLQFSYEAAQPELRVGLFLRRAGHLRVDRADGLHGEPPGSRSHLNHEGEQDPSRLPSLVSLPPPVVLYNCSVGHGDCSRCQTALPQYGCVWCEGARPRCVAREACREAEAVATQCPAPLIHSVRWNPALPCCCLWREGAGALGAWDPQVRG